MGDTQEHLSKVVLHDIRGLTTGQKWQPKGDDNKPVLVNAVTLELTPHEVRGTQSGQATKAESGLALRNRNNKTVAQTDGVTSTSFLLGDATNGKEPTVVGSGRSGRERC